jgi:hypothetical protein
VVKKKVPLTLSRKTREVAIKKDRSKTYPKNLIPMTASLKAVRETVIRLQGMGFSHIAALETLAAQMHENLVALKKFHNLTEGK